MNASDILKQFYIEINEWIESGCPEHDCFDEHLALCSALREWLNRKGMNIECHECSNIMARSFYYNGLSMFYPFNYGNLDFRQEGSAKGRYSNPKRLAWIKEQIEGYNNG